jgi:hypothetical protein
MERRREEEMSTSSRVSKTVGLRAICGLIAALAFAGPASVWGQARNVQAELDALVKAAKAEGEVTFYIGLTPNVATRIANAFNTKYGIKAQFLRLDAVALISRYSAEAES